METWVAGVKILAGFARAIPHTAYAGLKMTPQK